MVPTQEKRINLTNEQPTHQPCKGWELAAEWAREWPRVTSKVSPCAAVATDFARKARAQKQKES
jgi:hypothetical protein